MFIVGPSKLLNMPTSFPLVNIGYAMIGFFMPFCYIHALPEMSESMEGVYSKK
jgi:hypothetical protein